MRHLIIADKQDITKAGLHYVINNCIDESFGQIYTADDKSHLIKLLSENPNSVVILDYTLFDFSSITELHIMHEKYPETSWLLFSEELSDSFLRQMLINDLSFSILFKSNPLSEIEQAINCTYNYTQYLSRTIENHLNILRRTINNEDDFNLTPTEKEILKEIALGKTTKEIAATRNVSFHTIITHRKNIFRKIDVNNVHEATKYAMKAGVVDFSEYYI